MTPEPPEPTAQPETICGQPGAMLALGLSALPLVALFGLYCLWRALS